MKNHVKRFSPIFLTSALLAAVCASAAPAPAKTNSAAPASSNKTDAPESLTRKSVFQEDLKNGKDPFFPKSTRRSTKVPSVANVIVSPISQLALKGISGPANRRFALINNQPIGAGETATVRVPNGQVKVHCWEVRESSVLVSVEGDPEKKELRLKDSL